MHRYVRLCAGEEFPDINDLAPFKAVVIIEDRPASKWRDEASQWLVNSGCLYMAAWGIDCSEWDTAVDIANLQAFDFGEIPDERYVMTTWHESEPLQDVLEFVKLAAHHSNIVLKNVLMLHVSARDKRAEFEAMFRRA